VRGNGTRRSRERRYERRPPSTERVVVQEQLDELEGLGEETRTHGVKFRSAWCSGSGTVICRLMSEDSGLRMRKSPVSRSSGWGGASLDDIKERYQRCTPATERPTENSAHSAFSAVNLHGPSQVFSSLREHE
jgi:hypothetical protein